MRFRFYHILPALFLCLVCLQCTTVSRPPAAYTEGQKTVALSPAEKYSAEVLSYMMKVVLGRAGDPKHRDSWASRGLNIDLDFAAISEIMGDSAQDKKSLLVFDANILGLSEVLYYYNPKLNQFKGRSGNVSLYPSSEMVALRILLLQKMHRGERIRVGTLLDRQSLFLDPNALPGDADIQATGLRLEEIRLLQDIFSSEPQLFQHLESPCLIDSLIQLGVVEEDARADSIQKKSLNRPVQCRPHAGGTSPEAITIAILPSLIQEFEFGFSPDSSYPSGFRPSPFFVEMVDRLVDGIRESLEAAIAARVSAQGSGSSLDAERQFERIWGEQVLILLEDERPLVIYPETASAVVANTCPEADLVLILTGKDVYLALALEPDHVFPSVNRMYIDIMDIRRSQIDSITEDVAEFILERLSFGSSVLDADREAPLDSGRLDATRR